MKLYLLLLLSFLLALPALAAAQEPGPDALRKRMERISRRSMR